MSITVALLLLLAGFAFLIKGADFLVDGASGAARRLGVREIVIGLTIVSFGTSAPELVINMMAAWSGSYDLAVGNIVGSNIANVWLILGVSAVIYPLVVQRGTVWKEIPLSLLAAVALLVSLNDMVLDGAPASVLSRSDGLVLLLFFAIFLYYSYGISRISGSEQTVDEKAPRLPVAAAMIVGGLVGLTVGGRMIIAGATTVIAQLGISEGLVGLTVVALGTSLPELATSAVAAFRRQADIAVGNVVGSNIFNIFFVLALTSVIGPVPFDPQLNLDVVIMVVASLLLFLAMFVGKAHKLERWQGFGFIGLYVSYLCFLFWRG